MKKIVTRILVGALSGVFMFGAFAACGEAKPSDDTKKVSSENAESNADAGTTDAEKIVVGFTNAADSDAFDLARKIAFDEENVSRGNKIEVLHTDADHDMQRQLDQINDYIVKKVDVIIAIPVDSDGIIPGIEAANEAGIPVICLGIQSNGGKTIFVGSENYDAGKMQGEFMAANLPENAKILYLAGTPGYTHSTDRRIGFNEALAAAGRTDVETLADLSGEYYRDKAQALVDDWIQTYPAFDGIIAANDQMALGAVESLKSANRFEGVLVSGIDGLPEACESIKAGEMAQSVLQNAPGQAVKCYDVILDIVSGKDVGDSALVPFENITIENVDNYMS